jgi:hypothetical protein
MMKSKRSSFGSQRMDRSYLFLDLINGRLSTLRPQGRNRYPFKGGVIMKKIYFGAKAIALLSVMALFCSFLLGGSALAASKQDKKHDDNKKQKKVFTTDFRIEDCTWANTGRNAYFSLNINDFLRLTDGQVVLEITVLNETRLINFVTAKGVPLSVLTRVVQELESENGLLIERSRNFFARCLETNDIFYFGEDVFPVEIGGAWLAGQPVSDPAQPGLIMPGTFLLGARYFQEVAPGVAEDRAEHVALGLQISTEAGDFEDCVEVFETTRLEPRSKSTKRYCPGIGLVFDDGLELVDFDLAP